MALKRAFIAWNIGMAEKGIQDSKWKFQNMVCDEQEYLHTQAFTNYGVPSVLD